MSKLRKVLTVIIVVECVFVLFSNTQITSAQNVYSAFSATQMSDEVCGSIKGSEIASLVLSVDFVKKDFLYLKEKTIPQMWWGALLGLNDSLEYPIEREPLEELIRKLRERDYVLPGVKPFLTLEEVREERNARDLFLFLSHLCETGRIRDPERQVDSTLNRAFKSLSDPYSAYLDPQETYPIEKSLVQTEVEKETVSNTFVSNHALGSDLFLIKIDSFLSLDVAGEVEDSLKTIEAGCAYPNIILDLRDNPGGFTQAAIEVAADFLTDQVIVRFEDRNGSEVTVRRDPDTHHFGFGTLVILINGETASAAELVTSALGESGITTIGLKTYGKSVGQKINPLPNGGQSKITSIRLYSPGGNFWQGRGLIPTLQMNALSIASASEAMVQELNKNLKDFTLDSGVVTGYRYIREENPEKVSCEK